MIAYLRRQFNESFTQARYSRLLELVEAGTGIPLQFPHNETPVFLPRRLVERLCRYGRELAEQLVHDPAYMRESERAIPGRWRVPNETAQPLFVQADFGLVRDAAGEWDGRLVEIQGFPSIYAYQLFLSQCYREAYALDPSLDSLPDGLTREESIELLQRAVVGAGDPETVFLLDVDPGGQKTRGDFIRTGKLLGVRAFDIAQVRREGNSLYAGNRLIRRIYNRAIVDEMERSGIRLGFDYRDCLDVEWAGHPNWYFRLSKFSIPYFRHPAVPETRFLDQAGDFGDPAEWVLKPLFSFAGAGVVVGPTREQIDAVPEERRHDYVLQRRIRFEPALDTPHGMTQIEIRVMYIWLERLRPVNLVIRTGRGLMMGVDHNKGLAWVGASAAFIEP